MAQVAVDWDGTECIGDTLVRSSTYWMAPYEELTYIDMYDYTRGIKDSISNVAIQLPKGSIEKLIGRKLTWQDNPVEL